MDWHGVGATVVAPVTVAGVSVVEEGCSTVEVVGIVETTIDGRTVGLVSVAGALFVEPAFVVASSEVDDAPDEHEARIMTRAAVSRRPAAISSRTGHG